jgi:ubiquinone/menaquinone biosynthesis C-methylase UbiE
MKILFLMLLELSLVCLGGSRVTLWAGDAAAGVDTHYQLGERHAGGIGKYFLEREIAEVMGHQGADWLERSTREQEEKPSLLLDALHLKQTDVVADVGAGTGYYSFRIAPRVAKVLAVDIQQEMLDLLQAKAKTLGITNVSSVLGTITNPNLPENGVDLVLLVDVYHEFDHPVEMMTAIHKALSPNGRLVQVEYRGEDPTVPIKTLHKMTQYQARREMASFGFTWEQTVETMPWQHVLIYTK